MILNRFRILLNQGILKQSILFQGNNNFAKFCTSNPKTQLEDPTKFLEQVGVNEPNLYFSKIRQLDLGKNYFKHINPRKRKTLLEILDAYMENLKEKERVDFQKALDIYYDNLLDKENIDTLEGDKLDIDINILWHLYSLMIFDRIGSQYSRYEYLDQFQIIDAFNKRDKTKRNKVKYVFTSHPTQPNSLPQLHAIAKMLKGVEQNDFNYLKYAANLFIDANKNRVFTKPSYSEESLVYHGEYLPNMIQAISQAYESGFKDPEDYIEQPGTWMTFDFDNHPGMELGIMTYTHGLTIQLTVNEYLNIINEAQLHNNSQYQQIIDIFNQCLDYGSILKKISDEFRVAKVISQDEFYKQIPLFNLKKFEEQIVDKLNNIMKSCGYRNSKEYFIAKKLGKLFKIFKLTGVLGQIRLAGEDLQDENNIKPIIYQIMQEISILNSNIQAADMLIIANFQSIKQYQLVENLMEKYKIQNMEIVPLLETFSSTNTTKSSITMIASSDTRQRDGLLLTELRNFREQQRNPNKFIYMGQGITPERGGGPYELIHTKYKALIRTQRKRHIRTIQGHYFTSEFASRDLAFTFLLAGCDKINSGEEFEPTHNYMDFLFELDNYVGVPQRQMQNGQAYNDLYVKSLIVKTLVESFDFAGSRELSKPLVQLKGQRAIVQAYVNSDRCSFTHPELAFWNKVPADMLHQLANYYYENNPHVKYILYLYALMIRRCDLEFAVQEVGLDQDNQAFKDIKEGKQALNQFLESLGLGPYSRPMQKIWKQHMGCNISSTENELKGKEQIFKTFNRLQFYQVKKIIKNQVLGQPIDIPQKKLRIIQTALANITSFTGKG